MDEGSGAPWCRGGWVSSLAAISLVVADHLDEASFTCARRGLHPTLTRVLRFLGKKER